MLGLYSAITGILLIFCPFGIFCSLIRDMCTLLEFPVSYSARSSLMSNYPREGT